MDIAIVQRYICSASPLCPPRCTSQVEQTRAVSGVVTGRRRTGGALARPRNRAVTLAITARIGLTFRGIGPGITRFVPARTYSKVHTPTMDASETTPPEGQNGDGESYEETVRLLVRERVDLVELEVHDAVVDADREVRSGGDVEAALAQLENVLAHQLSVVARTREALPDGGDDGASR